MTDQPPHAPTTQGMLQKYIFQGGTLEEFYRWLDGVCMKYQQLGFSEGIDHAAETNETEITAAEQRGAVKALRELAKDAVLVPAAPDKAAKFYRDRADQMEGDDETH